jgi:hypothetical protein
MIAQTLRVDLVASIIADEPSSRLALDPITRVFVRTAKHGDGTAEPCCCRSLSTQGVREEVLDHAVDTDNVEIIWEELAAGF